MSSSIRDVDVDHYGAFTTALANLLRTSIAEHTYAEIIDGIPTAQTWQTCVGRRHDIIEAHRELCPGTLEAAQQFRADLRPENLRFNSTVLQAYGDSPLGSRTFKLRLIEMLAIACHDLAALLHQQYDGGLHKGAHAWKPVERSWSSPRWPSGSAPPPRPEPLPTVFYHGAYVAFDQYPNGVADMVGYWAESRLFGGVVVFDRGEDEAGCHDIFMHPFGGRRLLFQPSDEQIDRLCAFFMAPDSEEEEYEPSPPLPLVPEKHARRVDPWDAFESLHIFRNRYERKLPEFRPTNRHVALEDQPEAEDLFKRVKELLP